MSLTRALDELEAAAEALRVEIVRDHQWRTGDVDPSGAEPGGDVNGSPSLRAVR